MYFQFGPAIASVALFLTLSTRAQYTRGVCGEVSDNPSKPPNTRCNFEGTPTDTKAFSTFQTGGFETCRNLCLAGSKCLTFSYSPTDGNPVESSTAGTCAIFRRRLAGKALKKSSSRVYFWSRDCFVADYYDFKPVENGDFSGATFDPWYAIGTGQGSTVELVNGAAQITATCANGSCQSGPRNPRFGQAVFLCAGVKYRLTHDALQVPGQTSVSGGLPMGATLDIGGPDYRTATAFNGFTSDGLYDNTSEGRTYYAAGTVIHKTYEFTLTQSGIYGLTFAEYVSGGDDSHYLTMQFDNLVIEALPGGS